MKRLLVAVAMTGCQPGSSPRQETPPASCPGDTFGLAPGNEAAIDARFEARRGTLVTTSKTMVATSHALATQAGLSVLGRGGNAVDAFVAAALAEDVVLPGVTSTAGIAGVLVFEAKTKRLIYVHGGLADPIDPARRYRDEKAAGKWVLVPGAPGAYAELEARFGKLGLAATVEPAATLATDGFAIDQLYAGSIAGSRDKLLASSYGRSTFFHGDTPIAEGETLKQGAFGDTLRAFGRDPRFFYAGAWPKDAVATANAAGGTLTEEDFATYAPEVAAPMHRGFEGFDLYAAGDGGIRALVSVAAYEHLPATSLVDRLERVLRVHHAVEMEPVLHDRDLVSRGASTDLEPIVQSVLARAQTLQTTKRGVGGTHSSSVIVVDADGNVVVGTHTIESLNWGEGLFVGGVPLATSAPVSYDDATQAKTRMRIDTLTATIALKDGAPALALGVYGTALDPADAQILDAVLTRRLDAETAVLEPRIGFFVFDAKAISIDTSTNSVDPRFAPDLLCELKHRGFSLTRSMPGLPAGYVDTGFPTVVTMAPGKLQGMTPEVSFIHGVAAGD